MGAGYSSSSNVAQSVASAMTSVLDQTNMTFDQEVGQRQTIGFNNCDTFAGGDANFSQTATLNAALKMVADVKDDTNISNDIAQAMTQAAASSVGEMAIGYAGSSNVASTFASMNNNITTTINQSATVLTENEQSFQCNNSTITVGGNLNISQSASTDVDDSAGLSVDNTTQVENSISQTIDQTATSTIGMDMWSFLILGIAAIIGVVIFKVLEARARNQGLQDSHVRNCVVEMAASRSKLKGGDATSKLMVAQTSCPDCVDSCIQVNQSSHLYIHWGWFVTWLVLLIGFGTTIGVWYATVANRGCVHSDSCGLASSSSWASGCSCDLDNVLVTSSTATCKSPVTETISSVGVPVKYQYPLLYSMTSTTGTGESIGSASMQGLVISSLKKGQTEYNSNNGNNLFTLLTYENLWYNGNTRVQIQSLFNAAVRYIQGNSSKFSRLSAALGAQKSANAPTQSAAQLLFRYLNPLRLVFAGDTDAIYLESIMVGGNFSSTPLAADTGSKFSTVFQVPPQFRYDPTNTTSLGNCSVTTMTYTNSGQPYTTEYDSSDDNFCSDHARMQYPGADNASDVLTFGQAPSSQNFDVLDLISLLNGSFLNTEQAYTFQDGNGVKFSPLDVYCRFANLRGNDSDYGMMRLLYAGILSTQANMGPSTSLWGVNTLMKTGTATTNDFVYASGVIYDENMANYTGVSQESPVTLITVQADGAVTQGQYDVGAGFAMTSENGTPLSGQGFKATSDGIGYCRSAFYNESTLAVMWAVFAFWLLLFPGYILIRYYVGESQTTANRRNTEISASRQALSHERNVELANIKASAKTQASAPTISTPAPKPTSQPKPKRTQVVPVDNSAGNFMRVRKSRRRSRS